MKQRTNQQEGEMRKIAPKDIFTKYTIVSGSSIEQGFEGYYNKRITIQDWFNTAQEANEWEQKIELFIMQNRKDDTEN